MNNRTALLDEVLRNHGVNPAATAASGGALKEGVDAEVLAMEKEWSKIDKNVIFEADSLLESAMKESLQNAIYESDNSSDSKLDHLRLIEGIVFTENQGEKYVRDTIDPIIKTSGILMTDGCVPKYVQGVVYEAALSLFLTKENDIEGIKALVKMTEDARTSAEKELSEDITDEDAETESVTEGTKDDKEDTKPDENLEESEISEKSEQEILAQHLGYIFEDWQITDPKQTQLVMENAETLVKTTNPTCLCADIQELADIGPKNSDIDIKGYYKEDEEISEAVQMVRAKANAIRLNLQGMDLSEGGSGTNCNTAIATVGTIAAIIWKSTRDSEAVIENIEAIKARTNSTKNADKYTKAYDKQIARWASEEV